MHNEHGYTLWDTSAPTESVLQGRAVIWIYFSADWCPPYQVFIPLLKRLHSSMRAHCDKANKNIPHFEVVLVSQCQDAMATEQYFSAMPLAAMMHADTAGKRGLAPRERLGITTIPTLVLLDGEGAVLRQNAQEWLQEDPTGQQFPWWDAATPQVLTLWHNPGRMLPAYLSHSQDPQEKPHHLRPSGDLPTRSPSPTRHQQGTLNQAAYTMQLRR